VSTVAVLRVSGELDAASVVTLRSEADLMILDDEVGTLIVDLSEATAVEHDCLGLLVHLKMLACDNALRFAVRAVAAPVRAALDRAGLGAVFDVEGS
jgi:anti-anti-sigma factor